MTKSTTPNEIDVERGGLRRLYLAIRRFIFEFWQLEFMSRRLLGEALALQNDDPL